MFYGGEFKASYDTLDAAGRFAVKEFGSDPFLIRQVGALTSFILPASIAYRPLGEDARN